MVNYICDNCNAEFDYINHFQDHVMSKSACEKNLNKQFGCDFCDKKFTSETAKKYHMKKSCKNKTTENDIEKIKKELEETKNSLVETKIELKEANQKIENLEKKIQPENNNTSIANKNHINSHNTTNSNSHNTINQNIFIDFGKEKYELLSLKEKIKILHKCYDSILECTKYTHCNDRLPEQKNIKISNLRSKFGYKMVNGKYDAIEMDELLEDTVCNRAEDVRNILDENKDKIPQKVVDKINDLLEKVDTRDDTQMKKEKNKAKLLLYNNRPIK
jgi:hypothetical protein